MNHAAQKVGTWLRRGPSPYRNTRRYRKLAGMSQEELSLEAGMKRSYVSDPEQGTRNPSVRALGRLAEALKIEPHTLLKDQQCCSTYKMAHRPCWRLQLLAMSWAQNILPFCSASDAASIMA